MVGLELFATKGLEYLLVIGYLLLLVGCRRMVGPKRETRERGQTITTPLELQAFKMRDGLLYHQGHTWAAVDEDGLVRVGMDDFAQKLLGPITAVFPPRTGTQLAQGEPGWRVRVDGDSVAVLSPVEGQVIRWNEEVLRTPEVVNRDPYGDGWLLEVRVPNPSAVGRNLLSGPVALAWMDEVAERLERRFTTDSDFLAQERSGRVGLAELVAPHDWRAAAQDFMLTADVEAVGLEEEGERKELV